MLRSLWKCFQAIEPRPNGAILDFGSGPSIVNATLAREQFGRILMAEFDPGSREEVKKWLQKDPDTLNWAEIARQALRDADLSIAPGFEEDLRQKMVGIVSCNARSCPVIPNEELEEVGFKLTSSSATTPVEHLFDAIVSTLCLEVACRDKEEFADAIGKLRDLLLPDGYFVLAADYGIGSYNYSGSPVDAVPLTQWMIRKILTKSGFEIKEWFHKDVKCVCSECDVGHEDTGVEAAATHDYVCCKGMFVLLAQRKQNGAVISNAAVGNA
jgi:hypothetical protein